MLFDKKIESVSGDVTDIDSSEVLFLKQIEWIISHIEVFTSVFTI